MSIFKIIVCVIIGIIGFCLYLETMALDELIKKATKEEKKALDRITMATLLFPLFFISWIVAE